MQFQTPRLHFGQRPPVDEEDTGDGIPKPMTAKAIARRAAGIREAAEILAVLPGPGESLHAIMTARLDMTDVLNAILERKGRCDVAHIATLGYNRRNLGQLLAWLDAGTVGQVQLVASKFFRGHQGALAEETLAEFRKRRSSVAFVASHCKVMALAFTDGTRLAIEGSSNLCSNGSSREQFCVVSDTGLHDFHAAWIREMIARADSIKETKRAG
jgi:hypothetical protein